MILDNLLDGIAILRKYTKIAYPLTAEHDELWFDVSTRVPPADATKLRALGWFHNGDQEDDEGNLVLSDDDEPGFWGAFV